MMRTLPAWLVDGENLLVALCCLMAVVAVYNYRIGEVGGSVVATVGAGIALSFLVLLSD